jgi:hypothetical protein
VAEETPGGELMGIIIAIAVLLVAGFKHAAPLPWILGWAAVVWLIAIAFHWEQFLRELNLRSWAAVGRAASCVTIGAATYGVGWAVGWLF